MNSPMFRQAIALSYAQFLFDICINLVLYTFPHWPTQLDTPLSFAPPPRLQSYISRPTLNVTLCNKNVMQNNLTITIPAFRLAFSFLWSTQTRPLVYYCPQHILSPEYVRGTIEASLRDEVRAWVLRKPRVNSLILEAARNLQRKMRYLLTALPVDAFNLQLPPHVQAAPQRKVRNLGSLKVSRNGDRIQLTITTVDGYSISRPYPYGRVPEPAALKAQLLTLYHESL